MNRYSLFKTGLVCGLLALSSTGYSAMERSTDIHGTGPDGQSFNVEDNTSRNVDGDTMTRTTNIEGQDSNGQSGSYDRTTNTTVDNPGNLQLRHDIRQNYRESEEGY